MVTFKYGPGGALVCDEPIDGVTQPLDNNSEHYYGGKYMIGESMSQGAAKRIAELLGDKIEEPIPDRGVRV